jgi:SAM-dependent methyltransferase
MSVTKTLLMRAFGRPQGLLGRLGGRIMARVNADFGTWVGDLLKVGANDRVLEVGFGPGVVIENLARRTSSGHVAGIDPSREMVAQARVRNADAIRDVASICNTVPWKACRSITRASTRRWRSTRCRSGRTHRQACGRFVG